MRWETIGLSLVMIVCAGMTGLLIYDVTCYDSYKTTIIPVSLSSTEKNNMYVMDDCLNTYRVFLGNIYSFDDKSMVKLEYCRSHKIACEITMSKHPFGNIGISSVNIVNASVPESCNMNY